MTNLWTMEVPAAHVLRTTYSLYAYSILADKPIEDWEHLNTMAGEYGPTFVYLNTTTNEQMTVGTGSPNGYSVVVA